MPEIRVEVNHDLTADEAVVRLHGRLFEESDHRDKFELIEQTWDDHSLAFKIKSLGIFNVTGTVLFEDGKISVDLVTPYVPPVFRRGLENNISTDILRLLGTGA